MSLPHDFSLQHVHLQLWVMYCDIIMTVLKVVSLNQGWYIRWKWKHLLKFQVSPPLLDGNASPTLVMSVNSSWVLCMICCISVLFVASFYMSSIFIAAFCKCVFASACRHMDVEDKLESLHLCIVPLPTPCVMAVMRMTERAHTAALDIVQIMLKTATGEWGKQLACQIQMTV